MKLQILILVSLTILVAACNPSGEPQQTPADVLESADETVARYEPLEECFVDIAEGIDYDCGHVIVPEFHGVDNGRKITLSVLRLLSPAEGPAEPLFLGVGGPGEDGIGRGVITAGRLLESDSFASHLLATRDLVYFSQRGTVYSEPELTCPIHDAYAERVNAGNVTAQDLRQLVSDALLGCYEDIVEAGVDFKAFNSLENAADVDSIREVLGYDQIVYYGASYGTLLGQHLMRDFPESLSAVILDGVVSIDSLVFEEKIDERFDYALGQLLDLCAADAACGDAFPTLAQDIEAVYQQLQAEPYEVVTSSGAVFPVDGATFATALFGSLYNTTLSADVLS